LAKRGDQLFKEADFNPGLRPTEAVDFLVTLFGVRQGLDLHGSIAVALLPGPDADKVRVEALLNNFVAVVPVKDRDQMAGNFGFARGELPEGKVVAVPQPPKNFLKFAALRGGHFFLAQREKVLQQTLLARPLAGRLSPAQRTAFGTADVLLY